jgi:hypothetical protein
MITFLTTALITLLVVIYFFAEQNKFKGFGS